jgi:hypothetical protein
MQQPLAALHNNRHGAPQPASKCTALEQYPQDNSRYKVVTFATGNEEHQHRHTFPESVGLLDG